MDIRIFDIFLSFQAVIPIEHQEDLDKAIALLDQSPLLTSLRLFLTDDYDDSNDYDDDDDDYDRAASQYDYPLHSFHRRTYTDPDKYPFNVRTLFIDSI